MRITSPRASQGPGPAPPRCHRRQRRLRRRYAQDALPHLLCHSAVYVGAGSVFKSVAVAAASRGGRCTDGQCPCCKRAGGMRPPTPPPRSHSRSSRSCPGSIPARSAASTTAPALVRASRHTAYHADVLRLPTPELAPTAPTGARGARGGRRLPQEHAAAWLAGRRRPHRPTTARR
jgi:hypothetical protein